jgi:hypothetical protein
MFGDARPELIDDCGSFLDRARNALAKACRRLSNAGLTTDWDLPWRPTVVYYEWQFGTKYTYDKCWQLANVIPAIAKGTGELPRTGPNRRIDQIQSVYGSNHNVVRISCTNASGHTLVLIFDPWWAGCNNFYIDHPDTHKNWSVITPF